MVRLHSCSDWVMIPRNVTLQALKNKLYELTLAAGRALRWVARNAVAVALRPVPHIFAVVFNTRIRLLE